MNAQTPTMRSAALVAVLALVLTSCGGAPSSAPTVAPPTVAPATVAPTTMPIASAAPVATGAPEAVGATTETPSQPLTAPPAETSAPTQTATPAPSPTQTAEPLPSPANSLTTPPPDLALEEWITGLASPVYVVSPEDGSGDLYVVEKAGVIRIFRDGALVAEPFLDITDRVRSTGSEQGLLGLAFPLDSSTGGVFYVDYTDQGGNTVVSRMRRSPDASVADSSSEQVLVRVQQPAANHNGGMLAFGPDGYLYIGTGDGGSANDPFGNGQNPTTLLGKLLRIDVSDEQSTSYTVPADNPWLNARLGGREVLPEIWAIGLRNPWRFSFDRATGDLWIGDVGQNRYEEVDLVKAGTAGYNFGWSIMEGLQCLTGNTCDRTGLTLPVVEYEHVDGNCSISGGYVYRGADVPGLAGAYVYGDYCSGTIWGLYETSAGWESRVLAKTQRNISSFGQDAAGELYVVDLQGTIYRLRAAG